MEEKVKLLNDKRKEEYSQLINKIICDATKTLAEHDFFIGWCHFETGIVEDARTYKDKLRILSNIKTLSLND